MSLIVLPQHLISIGDEAFEDCSSLISIDIPSSTVSIGKNVFAKCTLLREVYVRNTSPSIVGTSIFSGIDRSLCTLYVPIGSKDVFANADGWKDFQSIEGIGCLNFKGITDPLNPGFTGTYPWVECVLHGNKILYKEYFEEECPCSRLSNQPVVEDMYKISFYVRDRQLCIYSPNQVYTILKIYSSDGKLVKSVNLREQTDKITSSLEGLASGSYLFIVGSSDSQQSGLFVVQ